MLDQYFSTHRKQPRPAREINLHVRAIERQAAINGVMASDSGSTRLAQALKALPHRVRLLVTFFL